MILIPGAGPCWPGPRVEGRCLSFFLAAVAAVVLETESPLPDRRVSGLGLQTLCGHGGHGNCCGLARWSRARRLGATGRNRKGFLAYLPVGLASASEGTRDQLPGSRPWEVGFVRSRDLACGAPLGFATKKAPWQGVVANGDEKRHPGKASPWAMETGTLANDRGTLADSGQRDPGRQVRV